MVFAVIAFVLMMLCSLSYLCTFWLVWDATQPRRLCRAPEFLVF